MCLCERLDDLKLRLGEQEWCLSSDAIAGWFSWFNWDIEESLFSQALSLNSVILMDFKRSECLKMICSNKIWWYKIDEATPAKHWRRFCHSHHCHASLSSWLLTRKTRVRKRAGDLPATISGAALLPPWNESCNQDRRINMPVSSSKDWYAQKNIDNTNKSFDAV